MTTVFDVPATPLVQETAKRLHEVPQVQLPEWAAFVKTGVHTEKPPTQADWWHTRVAAVLRKVYIEGPVGTERLRSEFGGFRDRGSKPNKARRGSGSIAREALQQLEAAGLVQTEQAKGRIVTAKGRSLLDNAAHAVRAVVQKELPALAKY
jgi:small subunit ribosomal protein S19e